MSGKYLVSYNVVYRVPTIKDVLQLREELSNLRHGRLESFSYSEKTIKEKGEIVEEYQQVKAKIVVNNEKEPESLVDLFLEYPTESERSLNDSCEYDDEERF